MKKKTSMALAALMLASSFAPQVIFAQNLTKDQKIEALKANHLISGYADGSLGLNKNVKRSEMAKLLVYALGQEKAAEALKNADSKFSDVGKTYWAKGMIAWATQEKAPGNGQTYLVGYPNGTFAPEKNITNAEMIKILVVLAKKDLTADQVKNAQWPTDWMKWAKEVKLIGEGTDLDQLDPNATASRETTFIALYNALGGNLKKEQETTTSTTQTQPTLSNTTTTASTAAAVSGEKRDPLWNQKYFQQYVKPKTEKKDDEKSYTRDWDYYNSRRDRYTYDYNKRAWWDSYNREWIYDRDYRFNDGYDWIYDADRGCYKRWDSYHREWIYDRGYRYNDRYDWVYDSDSGYYRRWDSDNNRWIYDYDRNYRYNDRYDWVYDSDSGYYRRWDSDNNRWIYDYSRRYNNYWNTDIDRWKYAGEYKYWDDNKKDWVYEDYSPAHRTWYYDSTNDRWWNYDQQRWYSSRDYYNGNIIPTR